jgi:predicted MPP superfamily phosphohydrolase
MQGRIERHTPKGTCARDAQLVKRLIPWAIRLSKLSGLAHLGRRNALDIQCRRLELSFPDLPPVFDGYRILHISDLHLDGDTTLIEAILAVTPTADLLVTTGDYVFGQGVAGPEVLDALKRIREKVSPPDGAVATLGNHDWAETGLAMEKIGYRLLANESLWIKRAGERLCLTGVDDVRRFYSPAADAALVENGDFRIIAVHSPDFADQAAAAGYRLYLCGHTHWGQIALPGGIPVFRLTDQGAAFSRGLWHHQGMTGWTSPGAGFSGAPLRFFTRGEVTEIVLRRK